MRGCEKKVVHLKNTGSALFEEAYFIIKENSEPCGTDEGKDVDLVREASRIIAENTDFEVKRRSPIGISTVLIFLSGAFISAAVSFMLYFLTRG